MSEEEEPASKLNGKMARHVGGGPEGRGVMGTEERKRLQGGVATRVSGSQDNQRR